MLKRDNLFDNFKGILIFLVVLGHFLQIGFRESGPIFQWLWVLIYSFHMPVFIFISGYFSRKRGREQGKSIHRLAIYYGIGWLIVCTMKSLTLGAWSFQSPLNPPFAMWYLLCLLLMRLLLPWISGIRGVFLLSVILSLLAGCTDKLGAFLALSRTVSLLPFFLAGALLADEERIKKLRSRTTAQKIILISIWLIVLAAFLYIMQRSNMNYDILWVKGSYKSSHMGTTFGILSRGIFLLSAFFTGLMILMLITDKKCFLTKWGRNSLPVYLFHIVIFYGFKYLNQIQPLQIQGTLICIGIVIVLSCVTVILLSADFLNNLLVKLVKEIENITWKGENYVAKK